MHISSLDSPFGIGNFGMGAYQFGDFLHQSGQRYWQVLPMHPTGFGNSPYQSYSTFAGNPYFIDPEQLLADGLLTQSEVDAVRTENTGKTAYDFLEQTRIPLLRLAYTRFVPTGAYLQFVREESCWLIDYALYMALKINNDQRAWNEWTDPLLVAHYQQALLRFAEENHSEIYFWKFVQFEFFAQWQKLKSYANERGIAIIGDIPIYVSADSADVWAHRSLFYYTDTNEPEFVAGCPPDYFSPDGQYWGNPVYRWEAHQQQNFAWWLSRIAIMHKLYDVLRIDHFRGIEAYYRIPFHAPDAKNGEWVKGPDRAFVDAVRQFAPDFPIIAEDLGFITQEVHDLLDYSGYPGMKVLQFAFGSREYPSDYLPHRYSRNCVVYTGTHDNDTILGWYENDPNFDRDYLNTYAGLSAQEGINWGVMRLAMSSIADLCILTAQDILNLGSEARMNRPATVGQNWLWRAQQGVFSCELAQKLLQLTKLYERLP